MPLSPSDVYSPQVPGLATVLGSGAAPLHVLQQEDYRAARAAAVAAKAKADREKLFTPPTPDTDGGATFANEISASAKNLEDYAITAYKRATDGEITPNEARALVASKSAEHNVVTKRAKEYDGIVNKFRNEAEGNFLNPDKLKGAMDMALTDPNTGVRYKSENFQPGSLEQLKTNGDLIDENRKTEDFIKGLALKQESDYATAARPGGVGVANTALSNFFESKNGKITYTQDADGKVVPKIHDIAGLEQAMMRDPQMAALLRNRLQKRQAASAESLMNQPAGQNADQELNSLNAQSDLNTPHSRQSVADILRPYGTMTAKQKESYRALPRPINVGGYTVVSPTNYQESTIGATIDKPGTSLVLGDQKYDDNPTGNNGYPVISAKDLPNNPQQTVYSPVSQGQPYLNNPKTGANKTIDLKGLPALEVIQEGENGSLVHEKNNKKPIWGTAQQGIVFLRNSATGEMRAGKNNKADFEKELRSLGPEWHLEGTVQTAVPKNKNYSKLYTKTFEDLKARESALEETRNGYRSKTDDQLEKEAADLSAGETTQSYLPNSPSLDAATHGVYRNYMKKIVPAEERRIRAGKNPVERPTRPTFLLKQATTTSPTQNAKKDGGMFN